MLALRDDTSDVPGEAPPEATPTTLVTPTVEVQTSPTIPTVDTTATRQASRQVAQQALTATAEGAAASATANASLPSPGEVVAAIKVGNGLGGVGGLPVGLATTDGALWVGNSADGAVSRIDPTTNEVVATIEITEPFIHGGNPFFIASYEDQVWASSIVAEKPFVRIDPATNQVVQTIPLIATDGSEGFSVSGLFVDSTGIWISDYYSGRLLHLDSDTGSVVATINVAGARGITAGFGSLWVASDEGSNASIMRVDVTSHSIVETIAVPGRVEFIATGAEAVWGNRPQFRSGLAHRPVNQFRVGGDRHWSERNPVHPGSSWQGLGQRLAGRGQYQWAADDRPSHERAQSIHRYRARDQLVDCRTERINLATHSDLNEVVRIEPAQ